MAGRATFRLDRSVFKGERTLLVRMAFNTSRISTGRQPGLFEFEPSMRIVAITAAHGALENFMMERRRERGFYFGVTTHTKLRVVRSQHSNS